MGRRRLPTRAAPAYNAAYDEAQIQAAADRETGLAAGRRPFSLQAALTPVVDAQDQLLARLPTYGPYPPMIE
jgi:hypothetical protein